MTEKLTDILQENKGAPIFAVATALILVLFFFSGATSLVYQVVWVRMFTQVFGSTSLAVSSVLTAFMAGLALGSFLAGQIADRHIRRSLLFYGILEGAIGIYALALPFLISLIEPLHVWLYRSYQPSSWTFILLRFAICFVFLLAPTTMMGATLPLIARFLVKHPQKLGQRIGLLYAINTAGAVAGCYLAGFIFIGSLGVTRTTHYAIVANELIMLLAVILGAYFGKSPMGDIPEEPLSLSSTDETSVEEGRGNVRLILLCFALAGFASLCYEVIWTRVLVFFLGFSTYAFSSMLTTFLLGLALGSLIFSRIADRSPDRFLLFFKIELVIALWAALSIPLFNEAFYAIYERWDYFIDVDLTWESVTGLKFLKAFIVLIVPTTLMGAAFPVVCRIFSSDLKHVGRDVAAVYSVNTVGGIIGSAAAGLIIIPTLGTQKGIMAVAAVNLSVAILALFMSRASARRKSVTLAILIGAAIIVGVFVPRDVILRIPHEKWKKLLFYKEDRMALVKVFEIAKDNKCISIDGDIVAGSSEIMQTHQKMLGHLPMLLHEDPQSVLIIGFGAGGTSYSISLYKPERIDIVEFVPSVLEAAPHLDEVNHGVLSYPFVHVTLDDGRTYLMTTDRKYDVISIDAIDPKHLGSANLYSKEFYKLCADNLNPGGVMVQWLPYHWLTQDEMAAILASFCSAFEYPTLWFNRHFTYFEMIGANHEIEIDYQRLSERLSSPEMAADMEYIHLDDPAEFLYCFAADSVAIKEVASKANALNTYDTPIIEYYKFREGDTLNHQPFAERRGFPKIKNLGQTPEEEEQNRENLAFHLEVANRLMRGLHVSWEEEPIRRLQYYRAALALNPSDVAAQWLVPLTEDLVNRRLKMTVNATRANPSPEAYFNLASIKYKIGGVPAAIEILEEAVQLFPNSIEMRLQLAEYYEQMGSNKKAAEQRQAIQALMKARGQP